MDNQSFCNDPNKWAEDEDAYDEMQWKWNQSLRTIDKLLTQIANMANITTQSFTNMKELRNELKAQLAIICQDIANIQKVQNSLDGAQKALKTSDDQKKQFSNYTKNETLTLNKIVAANYHSTVCTTHMPQNIICHQGCGLEFREQLGANHFSGCWCMNRGRIVTYRICGCGPYK